MFRFNFFVFRQRLLKQEQKAVTHTMDCLHRVDIQIHQTTKIHNPHKTS